MSYNAVIINDWATLPLLIGSAFAFASALLYGFGSPWWGSALGRAFLGIIVAATIVPVVPAARRLLGEYIGYEWIAVSLYTLHAAAWASIFFVILHERRHPPMFLPPVTKGTTMTTPTAPVPAYPVKRVLRTIVQALVVYVPITNAVAAALAAYLAEQGYVVVPGWAFLVLNGVVAVTALLAGAVARIMAVPGVNNVLAKLGLGVAPSDANSTKPLI